MLEKEKFFVLLLFCLGVFSCTKDVDFEQANDFQVSPVVESSLIFLNEPASQFVEDGVEITSIQDEVLINIFNDAFIVDHLTKAEFVFDITNSISRGFRLRVDFLDGMDQNLHVMTINVAASTDNSDSNQAHIETFEGNTLLALMATQKMVFTLYVLPGSPLSETSAGMIQLQSKGVFYLDIGSSL